MNKADIRTVFLVALGVLAAGAIVQVGSSLPGVGPVLARVRGGFSGATTPPAT